MHALSPSPQVRGEGGKAATKRRWTLLRTVEMFVIYKRVNCTLILLHTFSSVLRTNLGSRITNEKKYVIQKSLSVTQTGALCITEVALCNTDDSVCNIDEPVNVLRLLEFVCITEKNCM